MNTNAPIPAPAPSQPQGDAIDWLESLDGDAWADACEEIAAFVNRSKENTR